MFCAFKMANPELVGGYKPQEGYYAEAKWDCEKENCELWIERFGRCALAVDAYLKGQADMRAERGVKD